MFSPAPFGTGWLLPSKEDHEGILFRISNNSAGKNHGANNLLRIADSHTGITCGGEFVEGRDFENGKNKAKSVASGDRSSSIDLKGRKSIDSVKVQRGSSKTTDPMSSCEK